MFAADFLVAVFSSPTVRPIWGPPGSHLGWTVGFLEPSWHALFSASRTLHHEPVAQKIWNEKVILRTSKQKLFAGQQRIIRLRNPIFWLLISGSLIHTCLAWKACLIEGHTYYLKNVLNMLLIADCWALVMFMELLVAVGSPDDVMVNIGAVVVVLAASPVVDMTWMLKLTSTLLSLLLALLWLFSTVKIENIELLKILI